MWLCMGGIHYIPLRGDSLWGLPPGTPEREKGQGGQTLLKDTDKILIIFKSIPWNLEGQLHSSCAKFLLIIFLA